MKSLKLFIVGFLFCFALTYAVPTSAGIAGFKASLLTAFTSNFNAGEQAVIRNSFVTAYPAEWQARVASGTVDNPANRGQFGIDKITEYIQEVVKARQYADAVTAVPTPTPLPN